MHRVLLEREVDVRAEIVVPDSFCPGSFGGGFIVEKEDVGFNALLIENACGQSQNRVEIRFFEELFADFFACSAFSTLSGRTIAAFPAVVGQVFFLLAS